MICIGWRTRVLAWLLAAVAAGAAASPARAQPASAAPVLDVPYLPQSEALCGGAAAAMVMRYWGERTIYAEAFSDLVDRDAGGIRTAALSAALERRSWIAIAGPGDGDRVRQHLGQRRPVIALIEDRPGRFHYVVVVGWTGGKVIVHDPARAPSRILDEQSFTRAWQHADRWMLVALPPPTLSIPTVNNAGAATPSSPPEACAGLIAEGVRLAQKGDRESARRAIRAAADGCPGASAPFRELAGVDALDGNWAAAENHARQAVQRDPRDEHAWRILATAAYLQHRDSAALDAWNRVGEPAVDLVDVTGLERTRYAILARAVNLLPGNVVTVERLRLAERRARDVPAIAAARVTFHPLESGRAQIDAAVVERTVAPSSPIALGALGLRAATERELATSFASVTGGGELISASWRWWQHRPRVGLTIAAPAPAALGGGVWRLDAIRETETFGRVPFEEIRTSVGVGISNWVTARTRLEAGLSLDRWRGRDATGALTGGVEFWPQQDRLALEARGAVWAGSAQQFGSAALEARWRSSSVPLGSVWLASAGAQRTSADAPASLWPGADTGHARDVLLRAHPLLHDGIITGGVFGRQLVYGTGEWCRWTRPSRWPVRIAPAAFVDMARARQGLPSTDRRTQVDAGAGLRLSLAGFGVMRIDLAKGLRDGRTALSVGWTSR